MDIEHSRYPSKKSILLFSSWHMLTINPFIPNGISHRYQLEQSVFKGCKVVFFVFNSYFNRKFCKQTMDTLIRRRVLRRLIWVCTVCLCPTKRTPCLYGLRLRSSVIYVHGCPGSSLPVIIWTPTRKPTTTVFGVCKKVSFKPACIATKTG